MDVRRDVPAKVECGLSKGAANSGTALDGKSSSYTTVWKSVSQKQSLGLL